MYKPNYKTLLLIAFMSALILAFMPQPGKYITQTTDPTDLGELILNKEAMISPDQVAQWLMEEKPDLAIYDLRSNDDFAKYNIPYSENYPLPDFLKNSADIINEDMITVLASNGDNQASQVWLLLRMMGHENVYVLQGGMNYWVESIVAPSEPGSDSPDSEVFKYAFRKAAGASLSGGLSLTADSGEKKSSKPKFTPKKKKKKKARAGCSG